MKRVFIRDVVDIKSGLKVWEGLLEVFGILF